MKQIILLVDISAIFRLTESKKGKLYTNEDVLKELEKLATQTTKEGVRYKIILASPYPITFKQANKITIYFNKEDYFYPFPFALTEADIIHYEAAKIPNWQAILNAKLKLTKEQIVVLSNNDDFLTKNKMAGYAVNKIYWEGEILEEDLKQLNQALQQLDIGGKNLIVLDLDHALVLNQKSILMKETYLNNYLTESFNEHKDKLKNTHFKFLSSRPDPLNQIRELVEPIRNLVKTSPEIPETEKIKILHSLDTFTIDYKSAEPKTFLLFKLISKIENCFFKNSSGSNKFPLLGEQIKFFMVQPTETYPVKSQLEKTISIPVELDETCFVVAPKDKIQKNLKSLRIVELIKKEKLETYKNSICLYVEDFGPYVDAARQLALSLTNVKLVVIKVMTPDESIRELHQLFASLDNKFNSVPLSTSPHVLLANKNNCKETVLATIDTINDTEFNRSASP